MLASTDDGSPFCSTANAASSPTTSSCGRRTSHIDEVSGSCASSPAEIRPTARREVRLRASRGFHRGQERAVVLVAAARSPSSYFDDRAAAGLSSLSQPSAWRMGEEGDGRESTRGSVQDRAGYVTPAASRGLEPDGEYRRKPRAQKYDYSRNAVVSVTPCDDLVNDTKGASRETLGAVCELACAARVAVVIPCYNEARHDRRRRGGLPAPLPTATVYVYDNNSTDDTTALAAARARSSAASRCRAKATSYGGCSPTSRPSLCARRRRRNLRRGVGDAWSS